MYKIIENNQIIDVMETLRFVKYLPKSQRAISVGERQANGIISSDGGKIYHIAGTPNTFADEKKSVQYIAIDKKEYEKLTTQLKENEELVNRVTELEKMVKELSNLIRGE